MKKIVLVVLLFVIKSYCQPGVVVPLNTLAQDVQNGTYIKDLDNTFLPYVGTWKGVLNNKEYTFVFQLFAHHLNSYPNGTYYYQDYLKGKYEVKDLMTGNLLYSTISATSFDDFRILCVGSPENNRMDFLFTDNSANCYNSMTFVLLNISGNSNQLKYTGFSYYDPYIPSNCSYIDIYDIPVPIPKNFVLFTKQ
jgi:hypothetical protein